jgi:hypothetical protein
MSLLRKLTIPLFYGLTAFLALYNVLLHSGSHIPGIGVTDYYHFSWSYWWIKHALTTPGESVYYTNYVMFPYVTNLTHHTLGTFWFPLWALVQPVIGTFATFNVISFVAFTLAGWLTYVLLRREHVAAALALAGGVALQVTPMMLQAVWWSMPNLLGVFWYPAHILIWGQVARTADRRWRGIAWAFVEGAALWATAITDLQYLFYIAFLMGPYAFLTWIESRARWRLVGLGVLALAVFLALMWWVGPLPAMLEFEHDKAVPAVPVDAWSIPFPDGFISLESYQTHRTEAVGALIILIFASGLIASLLSPRRREWQQWVWFVMALAPLVSSPGSYIMLGDTRITMPYKVLHDAMNGVFRSPGRLGAVFVFAALVFAGRAWTPLLRRRPHALPWLAGGLLLAVLGYHHVLRSLPVQPAPPIYDFYRMMGREPYDYVVVEVPVSAGDGIVVVGSSDLNQPQFYGTIHGKRMINGHFSRTYVENYWYLRSDHAVLSWLGQRRPLEPDKVEPLLREMIYEYPVGYIVIHQDSIGLESPTNQEIIGYFNTLDDLLCPPLVEDHAVVYRTAWHPDGCPPRTPPDDLQGGYIVDIGAPGDERFLGWGWYWPEFPPGITWRWTGTQPQATLFVDLPPGDYILTLAAQSFWQAREVRIAVNGESLETLHVQTDQLDEFRVLVPAKTIGTGKQVTVQMVYDTPDVPRDVGQSADPRPLAVAVDWVRFTPAD